jgi:hypothetical protein
LYSIVKSIKSNYHSYLSIEGSKTVSRFVMHHQFALHEVKTIWNCLKRTSNHLLFKFFPEIREFVDCLHRILRVWHTEWYLKLEGLYEFTFEVMSFYHQKIFDWFRSYFELKSSANSPKLEEHGAKMILYISGGVRRFFTDLRFRLSNLKERDVVFCISNFEVYEFDIIDVILKCTEEVFGRLL